MYQISGFGFPNTEQYFRDKGQDARIKQAEERVRRIKNIQLVPEASRAELVRLGLSQDDPGARMAAAGMIEYVPCGIAAGRALGIGRKWNSPCPVAG
ncbi:hypothetical protein A2304_03210 [Candidatus Uhrbacteria bacterium RIFOXYB2_FULL_57_15]|uniref:Uncharacterized protein n=1 Tax=Candidatus Uhrbacteria bacterium RIFOXYB2_FULL_57_15 TaxID=1802422 RepID=A0A1F7W573_9BACT|nr:MAG: hypothetical protein A2304_03210 [Candidatus Uhrbacteria bacterium RIFOXYB2_FULL_57_15]